MRACALRDSRRIERKMKEKGRNKQRRQRKMGVGGWERNAQSSDSDREIETDRQADRQTDRQTDKMNILQKHSYRQHSKSSVA